jgi:hypothetical protein
MTFLFISGRIKNYHKGRAKVAVSREKLSIVFKMFRNQAPRPKPDFLRSSGMSISPNVVGSRFMISLSQIPFSET